MPADRRSEDEIRLAIAAERDGLERALADLRHGAGEQKRLAGIAGAALAVATALVIARRVKRG